jgi:hypothetical protein
MGLTDKLKQVAGGLILGMLLLALAAAGAVWWVRATDPADAAAFQPDAWVRSTGSERTPMLKSAAERVPEMARTREEVEELLGPPDSGGDERWTYVAGPADDRGVTRYYLGVKFDGDTVEDAFVYTD